MQEINRFSKEVILFSKRSIRFNHINVDEKDRNIYFTKPIVLLCGLKAGEYVHFLNDYTDWKFYSNDNTDGFRLSHNKQCLRITNIALSRLILKTTGFNKKKHFYVKKTNMEVDKCPVFKLTPYR